MWGFIHYMFAPTDSPWYTGAFWSNQVQWTIVTLPAFLYGLWHVDRRSKKRHEELKAHITAQGTTNNARPQTRRLR